MFTFGAEAKARKTLAFAEERLAEAQAMVAKGREDLAEEPAAEYGSLISNAAEILSQSAMEGGDVEDALADLVDKATGIHQQVLADVYEKVPAEAQRGIEEAMEQSVRGQSEAINALSGDKKEEIMDMVEERKGGPAELPSQAPEGVGPGQEQEGEEGTAPEIEQKPSVPGAPGGAGGEQGPPAGVGMPGGEEETETSPETPEEGTSGGGSEQPEGAGGNSGGVDIPGM